MRYLTHSSFVMILLGTAITVVSCSGGGKNSRDAIYAIDFSDRNHQWASIETLIENVEDVRQKIDCWQSWKRLYACTVIAPTDDERLFLEAPLWLDPNHTYPGIGYLNLLA